MEGEGEDLEKDSNGDRRERKKSKLGHSFLGHRACSQIGKVQKLTAGKMGGARGET